VPAEEKDVWAWRHGVVGSMEVIRPRRVGGVLTETELNEKRRTGDYELIMVCHVHVHSITSSQVKSMVRGTCGRLGPDGTSTWKGVVPCIQPLKFFNH